MPGQNVWSLLGMLALVVGILFLAWWCTRLLGRMQARGGGPGAGSGGNRFRVLRQLDLGRNERLVLVRIQDRCCLLGVTAGGITLLKELEGAEAEEWISQTEAASPGFGELLRANLRKKK